MTIDSIKNNIETYSLDDISHFWKLSKVYMEKTKKDTNSFEQLQTFQCFLERRMKKIKRLRKLELL